MRQILPVLLLFASSAIQAQEYAVGVRTGIGHNFFLRNGLDLPANTTWDKQVFLRYQSKKRFAGEVGITHYGFRNTSLSAYNWEHFGRVLVATTTRSQYFSFSLAFQYDLSGKSLQASSLGRFRHYVGIQICPVHIRTRSTGTSFHLSQNKEQTFSEKDSYNLIMGGFSYTTVYKLAKQLAISSVLAYNVDFPAALSTSAAPIHNGFQQHVTCQVGLSYLL